jgi:hypothetical protein
MSDRVNLADPAFEPSGEQLQSLAGRAFAGVREAREASMERLRLAIARERERVLVSLRETATREKTTP